MCRDMLKRYIPQDASVQKRKILDLGCGTGFWTKYLFDYGDVTALDSANEALSICGEQQLKHLIQGDAERLPIADNSYDLVTALGLMEHVDSDRNFIKEVRRVLKPDGHALILTSAYMFLWGAHDGFAHHKRRYTQNTLKSLLRESGFEIVKISYVNTFLFFPILLSRLSERIYPKKIDEQKGSPDFFMPPAPLNETLYGFLRLESWLLKWMGMPFGVGLLAFVRKTRS